MPKMKDCVKRIDNFYSDDVVFEGSMAYFTWELDMDVGTDGSGADESGTDKSGTDGSSGSESDSSTAFVVHFAAQKATRKQSVSSDQACVFEASTSSAGSPLVYPEHDDEIDVKM